MASNVGKGMKSFVPAQSQQVGVMQAGGHQLGRQTAVQPDNRLAERPMNIMKPQQMAQGGGPRGAQEIKVVGMQPQAPNSRVAQQMVPPAAPQIEQRPAMQPVLGLSGAGSPQAPASEETHSVEVIGEGPDGREYAAPFDVVFPKGSKILGIRKIQ
jgi:hypothetical protein